jgi:hypothetical protein
MARASGLDDLTQASMQALDGIGNRYEECGAYVKPQKKGNQRGSAYAYNVKTLRGQEMQIAEQAERNYGEHPPWERPWLRLISSCALSSRSSQIAMHSTTGIDWNAFETR